MGGPDDLPGPEGDPLRIQIVCPENTGILLSFCACIAGSQEVYTCCPPKHIRCKKIPNMLLAPTFYVLLERSAIPSWIACPPLDVLQFTLLECAAVTLRLRKCMCFALYRPPSSAHMCCMLCLSLGLKAYLTQPIAALTCTMGGSEAAQHTHLSSRLQGSGFVSVLGLCMPACSGL